MARRNRRAGEGEKFSEYFDESLSPIISGSHHGVRYKIFCIPRGTKEGHVDSHYTGYICLGDFVDDWDDVYIDDLPPAPGHHGLNFGPTEDGWIGFGTVDGRDHNFDENMEPLEADERMEEKELFGNDTIFRFTPEILHSSVLEWITKVGEDLDVWEKRKPDVENYATQD